MRLQQLVHGLQSGRLPHRAVAITFDDGYADNLFNARPLLEHYDVPATIFVTTGHIGCKSEFWWDELDRLLLQPGRLPECLHVSVNGSAYQWHLGEAAHYSEDASRRYSSWSMGENDDPSPRHTLYRSLYQLLRPLPDGERRSVLNGLVAWAGVEPVGRPTHRILSLDETVALAEGTMIDIGAHTVTHPVLSTLPATAQRAEIEGAKARLEEILGHLVTSLAYPYGSRSDYTSETVTIVKKAGFTYACSNFAGVVRRGTDRFQLPRFVVRDWDGEEFARCLEYWFRA